MQREIDDENLNVIVKRHLISITEIMYIWRYFRPKLTMKSHSINPF